MTMKTSSLAAVAAVFLLAGASLAQDTVKLRNGDKVTGQITAHDENGITLKTGGSKKEYKWTSWPRCAHTSFSGST